MAIVKLVGAKISGYSLPLLFRLELESLFFRLGSAVPTTLGIVVRAALCRVFFKSCAGFCWIQPTVTFVHTERLSVGSAFGVNSGSYINAIGGIDIGNHVLLGSNVTISSGMHPIDGRDSAVFARATIPKRITIEDDVWIGAGAVIMPGVRLATGSVVGANAVVTKDTQEYSVNVGIPARCVRFRKEDVEPQN